MSLEKARKELEVQKMIMAIKELEFKVLEREDDIQRLKNNIEKCQARHDELLGELKE